MIEGKFQGKKDKKDIVAGMTLAVDRAKELGAASIGVNAEDASRTDMGYLIEFAQAAKETGADRIRYCDTLGYDTPMSIYERIKTLAEKVKMGVHTKRFVIWEICEYISQCSHFANYTLVSG